jgi:hypothetical protein
MVDCFQRIPNTVVMLIIKYIGLQDINNSLFAPHITIMQVCKEWLDFFKYYFIILSVSMVSRYRAFQENTDLATMFLRDYRISSEKNNSIETYKFRDAIRGLLLYL